MKRSPAARYLAGAGSSNGRVSKPGMDWIKMAFAAPDFPVLTPSGIPDQYTGRTLVQMFRHVEGIKVPSDDYYILVPPVPGTAYFTCQGDGIPKQQAIWSGTRYSNADSLFLATPGENANIVTAFRYMANLVELVPTTNNMTWSGSISVFKVPLKMTLAEYTQKVSVAGADYEATASAYTITGMRAIQSTNSDQYTAPSNLGCFTAAHQNNNDFPFTPTIEGYDSVPRETTTPAALVPPTQYGQLHCSHGFPGFGQLDTVVIRITGAKDNTFVLKTWASMELQIQNDSSLYQYTVQSPLYDPYALQAYNQLVRASPNAVSYYENSGFWNFIKNAIKTVSGALSKLPGPVGAIANGVNAAVGLFK